MFLVDRMLGWLRGKRGATATYRALVDADAVDLIHRFGDEAYYEARDRDREDRKGGLIDANRPLRHWSAVKLRIADVTGRTIGRDTATRYGREK